MPHGREFFIRKHIGRKYPRRVEDTTPAEGVDESTRGKCGAEAADILPWIVERIVPTSGTQVNHGIRIPQGPPKPTVGGKYGPAQLAPRDVHTSHSHLKRILHEVTFDGLQLHFLCFRRVREAADRIFGIFMISGTAHRLLTDLLYLLFHHLFPLPVFLLLYEDAMIAVLAEHDLHPYLLLGLQ